jgi:hypothetical protein
MLNSNFDTSTGFIMVVIGIADPAAGANFTTTFPAGYIHELISLKFALTTDANVANRQPRITISNGAVVFTQFFSTIVTTASLIYTYNFNLYQTHSTMAPGALHISAPLPSGIVLGPSYILTSLVAGLQVGDTLDNIVGTYKRWLIPT